MQVLYIQPVFLHNGWPRRTHSWAKRNLFLFNCCYYREPRQRNIPCCMSEFHFQKEVKCQNHFFCTDFLACISLITFLAGCPISQLFLAHRVHCVPDRRGIHKGYYVWNLVFTGQRNICWLYRMSSISKLSFQEWWVVALRLSLCLNRISDSFCNNWNLSLMWFQRSELATWFWKHRKISLCNRGVLLWYALSQCLLNTLIESLSLNVVTFGWRLQVKNSLNEGMLCIFVINGVPCSTTDLVPYILLLCALLPVSCFLQNLPFPQTEMK